MTSLTLIDHIYKGACPSKWPFPPTSEPRENLKYHYYGSTIKYNFLPSNVTLYCMVTQIGNCKRFLIILLIMHLSLNLFYPLQRKLRKSENLHLDIFNIDNFKGSTFTASH